MIPPEISLIPSYSSLVTHLGDEMWYLALASCFPAIGMVGCSTDFAHNYASGIFLLDHVETIGASVLGFGDDLRPRTSPHWQGATACPGGQLEVGQ
jgi:hypothetical protein